MFVSHLFQSPKLLAKIQKFHPKCKEEKVQSGISRRIPIPNSFHSHSPIPFHFLATPSSTVVSLESRIRTTMMLLSRFLQPTRHLLHTHPRFTLHAGPGASSWGARSRRSRGSSGAVVGSVCSVDALVVLLCVLLERGPGLVEAGCGGGG